MKRLLSEITSQPIPVGMEGVRVYRHGPHAELAWGIGIVTVDNGGHNVYVEFPDARGGQRDGWWARASLMPVEPLTEREIALRDYGAALRQRDDALAELRKAERRLDRRLDALALHTAEGKEG